ncbi:hypothetical protein AVEN_272026-1, partial [Araneus ventricosus]
WIPAHVGIRGNEQADTAAKSAVVYRSEPLPYADIKSALRNWMRNNWQNDWNLEVDNKLHEVKPIVTQWTSSFNRKYEVTLTRLRIGHSRLTHKYLLFGESPPVCSRCNVLLTIRHVLIDCSSFDSAAWPILALVP